MRSVAHSSRHFLKTEEMLCLFKVDRQRDIWFGKKDTNLKTLFRINDFDV